jgi:molecular chaperone GrpE
MSEEQEKVEEKEKETQEDISEESSEEVVEESEQSTETPEDEVEEREEIPADSDSQLLEYRDKLLRKVAEFENYKKRTSQEFIRLVESANQELILKLLPVKDDIERFEKNYSEEHGVKELKKGVDLIFEKFNNTLKGIGLEELEVLGKEFDPELHEALLQVDNPAAEPNTIIDQHEKGYLLKDKVIRHAKVIVAK